MPPNAWGTTEPVFYAAASTPFSPETIKAVYPDRSAWFAKYGAATDHLVETGVIAPDDAAMMLAHAQSRSLPI